MSGQTRRINISNQKKRRILCIANEYDYLGDSAIIHEEKLQVGKQYTFVKGEVRSKLERMKELCKERNNLYEKQNDLKGQKQKIEKSLER